MQENCIQLPCINFLSPYDVLSLVIYSFFKLKRISPQSRSLFSALFETFCLTARAYMNTQKYGRVRLARFARVRLLRHALPISLLILRKKPTVLQSTVFCEISVRKSKNCVEFSVA